MSRWGTALRIARRTARRSPGRTALIAALVAAPVLGTTFLDTAFRTADLTAATDTERELGAADGAITVSDFSRITADGTNWTTEGDPDRDPAGVDLARLLPAGSRLLPQPTESPVAFRTEDRTTLAPGRELDWSDPMAAGILALREGRFAGAAGEVTLSPALAERLGAGIGDEVRPADGAAQRVVGIAADPSCRSCLLAAGLPGWTGADRAEATGFLVALPAGTDARELQGRLAASGVFLLPRDARLHPERWESTTFPQGENEDRTLLAIIVLVAGIGMLEVVLLAGTAFAVAARRQVRDSALVLSNGGRRSDVRLMLLAQGVVLGVLGSVTGLVLGVLAVLVAWRPLERLVDQDFGGLVVAPRDLAVAGLVGVAAGIAAAVVPAWSASRVPVVAALAGRHGRPTRARRRLAAAAIGVAIGGLVLAGAVAVQWAQARRDGDGRSLLYPFAMVAGFGLTMVALTVLAPSMVGLAGRLAGRLPLTGRLALRDAARHRHRTGPAVGAVMVAVAGSVAVSFALASYDTRDRESYRPVLPAGWAQFYLNSGDGVPDDGRLAMARTAAAELPSTGVVPVPAARPADPDATLWPQWVAPAGNCDSGSDITIGAPVARLLAGTRGDEAAAALAAGKAVVTDPCLVQDGTVTFGLSDGTRTDRATTLPALLLPAPDGLFLPRGVVSEEIVRRAGLTVSTNRVLVPTSREPTAAEEDRARTVFGPVAGVIEVERGYGAPYLPGFVALIGGAGLVTLAGVAISVSLSAAEGRADLATLAAIGAPPRRRRLLAMGQAALVAGLGVGLGVLLGAVIGTTIMSGLDGYPLVVPWSTVLLVGVGVPALGVVAVGLLTRSRLPMARRLG